MKQLGNLHSFENVGQVRNLSYSLLMYYGVDEFEDRTLFAAALLSNETTIFYSRSFESSAAANHRFVVYYCTYISYGTCAAVAQGHHEVLIRLCVPVL